MRFFSATRYNMGNYQNQKYKKSEKKLIMCIINDS